MRKKSHIALARYLVRQNINLDLFQHKKAFYFGSIQPDLNPGMLSAPHEFDLSYDEIKKCIRDLADGLYGMFDSAIFWRKLGFVLHYLADYFTFPHNTTYDGTLKDHCVYEGEMKHYLHYYVYTPEAAGVFRRQKYGCGRFETTEDLLCYIEESHRIYDWEPHSVENDCRWIVKVCSRVMTGMLDLAGAGGKNTAEDLRLRAA